jgi:hypothetical protein
MRISLLKGIDPRSDVHRGDQALVDELEAIALPVQNIGGVVSRIEV